MTTPLRIIIPADVFPPGSVGGAAWSSLALAQALGRRGHSVVALVPRSGQRGIVRREQSGVPVVELGYRAPGLPFLQNWFRFERLWPRLARQIEALARQPLPVVIHGQHAQTIPAAVLAARRLGAPAVATIRDYWPLHYFTTGLLGDRVPVERFGALASAIDLLARLGPLRGAPALLALPYLLRHLRRRAGLLAQADAVIGVSGYVSRRLSGLVAPERLHSIPTAVDLGELDRSAAPEPRTPLDGRFVLFAGKLERNKGAHLLPEVVAAAQRAGAHGWTLLLAGRGALRPMLERELAGLGQPARFLDWVDHDEVARLTMRCDALLFPSGWAEPLTRVLVEGSALGAPIAAMATGGTPDIVRDGASGLLAHTAEGLGRALAELLTRPELAARLGQQARREAEARFAAPVVAAQHEQLYLRLLEEPSTNG